MSATSETVFGSVSVADIEKRPSNKSPEVINAIVEKLLPDVMEWLNTDGGQHDEESARKDLHKALTTTWDWDGYKLVHYGLDDYAGDARLVEIMDQASSHQYTAHNQAVRAWVAHHGVQVSLVKGDKVSYVQNRETITGEITDVHHETAEVVVFVESAGHVREGLGSYGFVVAAERCTKIG